MSQRIAIVLLVLFAVLSLIVWVKGPCEWFKYSTVPGRCIEQMIQQHGGK